VVRLTGHDSDPKPQTRATLTELDWLHGDIADLRQRYEAACRIIPERATWQAITVEGRALGLLSHTPLQSRQRDRFIVYFHGGGWIVGSPLTHADISGALCDISGIDVISVDYRLAPENTADAQIEDGLAAVSYALARMPDQNGSIILAGDSAGATIALAVASQAPPTLRGKIGGVCACYGSYGLLESESLRLLGSRAQGLDRDCMRRMWLAANPASATSPYSIESIVSGVSPPVYVLVGSEDPLVDDSLALVEALKRAGHNVYLDMVAGVAHGFLHGAQNSETTRSALGRMAVWLTVNR
jgi:acetyl esterase/lipase